MSQTETLSRLRTIDDYEFEHFVADLWERQGWDTEVSQASMDAGIDIEAKTYNPVETSAAIQVKRYGEDSRVSGPEIQQYNSLRAQFGTDTVIVVTTGQFTKQAEQRADELNVKLVDGHDLVRILEEFDAADLVDEYAPRQTGVSKAASKRLGDGAGQAVGKAESRVLGTDPDEGRSGRARPHHILLRGWGPNESWGRHHIQWHLLIATLFVVQMAAYWRLFDPSFLPVLTEGTATLLAGAIWFFLPGFVFLDAINLHRGPSDRSPNRIVWPFISFFPIIGPAAYLYVRFT